MSKSQEQQTPVIQLLSRALHRIRSTPPRIIASPPTQPRRAAVALIIRIVPSQSFPFQDSSAYNQPDISQFFELDWVRDPGARAEILFLRRDSQQPAEISAFRVRNTNEAHVAFPGGRMEDGDEGSLYTAMRQTWEEIGLDLAERDYLCIGQLDDREITTSLGKRLLMILSPFVFLQLTPTEPRTEPIPATTLHWTPLSELIAPDEWSCVTVDAASRLAPKNSTALRWLVRMLVGSMQFPAIVLDPSNTTTITASPSMPNGPAAAFIPHSILEKGVQPPAQPQPERLKLWGLSLGMVLDLLSFMGQDPPTVPTRSSSPTGLGLLTQQLPFQGTGETMGSDIITPSLASVFPRFSYPDVNFWIWVFGKRYREVVRGWETSVRAGGTNDRRMNWAGSALSTFYAAIRKALVVVILLRAIGIMVGLAFAGWWVFA